MNLTHVGSQRLETERLILRRFRVEDAQEMFSGWANDLEISRYVTWPPHGELTVTRQLLAE